MIKRMIKHCATLIIEVRDSVSHDYIFFIFQIRLARLDYHMVICLHDDVSVASCTQSLLQDAAWVCSVSFVLIVCSIGVRFVSWGCSVLQTTPRFDLQQLIYLPQVSGEGLVAMTRFWCT